jgi:chromate transporter
LHRPSVLSVFAEFLKLGFVVFGSGYVLLAFLRRDLVGAHGWLDTRQLLDAVSVGQFTPGPVFTTATFIGYLVAGTPGAIVATIGIFLPSFVMMALLAPLVPKLRMSAWTSAALDGLTVGALGLMAGVTVDLGRRALVDPLTVVIAVAALVLLERRDVPSVALLAGGAVIGVVHALV